MTQKSKADAFAKLHVRGTPLVLYNAWDAGSAKAIAEAGAKAIATSSWAVAAAQGYEDGEDIPLEVLLPIVARIVKTVDLPVSVDFEGGYTEDDGKLSDNIAALIDQGVIGVNFEDRIVKGSGLYDIDRQAARIGAIRRTADAKSVPLFINARTDTFFGQSGKPVDLMDQATKRAKAYTDAGASGLFVPGLVDADLINHLAATISVPLNVMIWKGLPSEDRLAKLGVARISHGAGSYATAYSAIRKDAAMALA